MWKPNMGKPPIQIVTFFHSSKVSPIRSQPCLKVTKHIVRCDPVRGFNHPVRSGLVRGL